MSYKVIFSNKLSDLAKFNSIIILGLASRLCDGDPAMWLDPNVENCSTVEITKIKEEVNNLMAIFAAFQNPNNTDRTLTIQPDILQTITEELVTNTNKNDKAILPNDLENAISIVENIIRLVCTGLLICISKTVV